MSKILAALKVCEYSQCQPPYLTIGSLCNLDGCYCKNWNKSETFNKCFVRKKELREIR